jgi:hypothetical protein
VDESKYASQFCTNFMLVKPHSLLAEMPQTMGQMVIWKAGYEKRKLE